MTRQKKPAGHRRHGHKLHPANECGICAELHPRGEYHDKKSHPPMDDLPSLDEIPVLGEEENGN